MKPSNESTGFFDNDGKRVDVATFLQQAEENRKRRERVLARMTSAERKRLEMRYATNTAHVSTSRRRPATPVAVPRRANAASGRPRAAAARSSAKSGDSGDGGGGGDEPPPPRTTQRWRQVKGGWAERENKRLDNEFDDALANDEPLALFDEPRMREGRFRGGPLDGQRQLVPAHSPAWLRYWAPNDVAPHWYVIVARSRATWEYVGHGDRHVLDMEGGAR